MQGHSSREASLTPHVQRMRAPESLCMSNEMVVDVMWLHVPGISGEGTV